MLLGKEKRYFKISWWCLVYDMVMEKYRCSVNLTACYTIFVSRFYNVVVCFCRWVGSPTWDCTQLKVGHGKTMCCLSNMVNFFSKFPEMTHHSSLVRASYETSFVSSTDKYFASSDAVLNVVCNIGSYYYRAVIQIVLLVYIQYWLVVPVTDAILGWHKTYELQWNCFSSFSSF